MSKTPCERKPCDFSVKGTFMNMLSIGASTNDCIGEEIDNSLDAGANRIRLYINSRESREIVIADNGTGMDKQTLRHAYQLNNRSDLRMVNKVRLGLEIIWQKLT